MPRRSFAPGVEPMEGRHLLSTLGIRRGSAALPSASRGTTLRNLPYRSEGDRVERLDVYRPAGDPPPGGWPVVLAIHGGGWRKFSKESYGPKLAPLVKAGYTVVSPSYTLSAPGRPSWTENREDLRDALAWISSSGPERGLDPGRIAAMGESSGAHLALLLGTDQQSNDLPRVRAVVDYYGPADLLALDGATWGGTAAVRQFLGGPSSLLRDRYLAASPIEFVTPDDPPTLMIHGTADPIVPFSQSVAMSARLDAAGVTNRLIQLPGVGHGFGFQVGGRNLLTEILGFLRRSLSGPQSLTSR